MTVDWKAIATALAEGHRDYMDGAGPAVYTALAEYDAAMMADGRESAESLSRNVTAALAYIYACTDAERGNNLWPFEPETFQPTWPVDNLVKAGGLIDAEIGRLRSRSAREMANELRAGTFRP